ncbi:MAG: hypothetical protein HYY03_06105 [Chloroflexi bacterium]|nr:hypothetical protein [Chloroflexota bacterium]
MSGNRYLAAVLLAGVIGLLATLTLTGVVERPWGGGATTEARTIALSEGIFGPVGELPLYPAAAGGTPVISFQGRLTNPTTGLPVGDGDYSVTFRIYDAATAGNNLWTETQPTVAVSGGLFSVMLGSVTALTASVFDGTDRYLEVEVSGDPPMTPRLQFGYVSYAFLAEEASNAALLDGVDSGQLLRSDTSDSYTGGVLTLNTGTVLDLRNANTSGEPRFGVRLSAGGGEGSSALCYFEDGNYCGEGLTWEDPGDVFSLSDDTQVQGSLSVSGTVAMGYEQVVVPAGFHSGGFVETRTATCPAGKVVLGGGVSIDNLDSARVMRSYPSSASSWTGTAAGNDSAFAIYAICARMGP